MRKIIEIPVGDLMSAPVLNDVAGGKVVVGVLTRRDLITALKA
jgi:hypothetical protein